VEPVRLDRADDLGIDRVALGYPAQRATADEARRLIALRRHHVALPAALELRGEGVEPLRDRGGLGAREIGIGTDTRRQRALDRRLFDGGAMADRADQRLQGVLGLERLLDPMAQIGAGDAAAA